MKVWHVGGKGFFNKFSNLEAAILRAQDDDVIELHKDVVDAAFYITKNITINGNGHLIIPKDHKTAMDCVSFITLNNIRFHCPPRTNAVILRKGGSLSHIHTHITGPARALYPTVIHRNGEMTVTDSEIMYLDVQNASAVTHMKNCYILDYYGGFAYLENKSATLSKFRGMTDISDSVLVSSYLDGECYLENVTLENFNLAVGTVHLKSCELSALRNEAMDFSNCNEPADGPLKDWRPEVTPYALFITGGKVTVDGYTSNMGRDCIGFYMVSGSLDMHSVKNHNPKGWHLFKGGSLTLNNVEDDALYDVRNARYGLVRSNVNLSVSVKSAMDQLDSMIGLHAVKKQLRTIMNTIRINMQHPEKDFGFSHHMVFAGDPGTGKTTVAKLVAQALFEIGAIPQNKCMEIPASQLIKGYVGQTGEHVESIMKQALGGVLFIDEAYELMIKDDQGTFNNDALAVLIRYMEDHRHELVVIAAGYEKEMQEFLASNIGLTRRFQWVTFEDYTPEEMSSIFLSMSAACKEIYDFDNPQLLLTECFVRLTGFYQTHPDAKGRITNGGNGGLVRNLFQRIMFARNNRIAEFPGSTMAITEDDVRIGYQEEMQKAISIQMV